MENEIKVNEYIRTKDGVIAKVTYVDGLMVDTDNVVFDLDNLSMMEIPIEYVDEYIVKHSTNLIDIIEDEDFCKIEFYSPRYEKRGTRIFEVSKIDEYITFENIHCDLFMINGEWSNNDKRLNPVIKEIYTKEMMESISYKVTKM